MPVDVSFEVLTISALLLAESKATKVVLSGEIAMRPGEPPALTGAALTSVSISPSMISRPGKAVGLAALCEARTRVATPLLGAAAVPTFPQATRLKLTTTNRAGKSAALIRSDFKRQAPNNMTDGDLAAK